MRVEQTNKLACLGNKSHALAIDFNILFNCSAKQYHSLNRSNPLALHLNGFPCYA